MMVISPDLEVKLGVNENEMILVDMDFVAACGTPMEVLGGS